MTIVLKVSLRGPKHQNTSIVLNVPLSVKYRRHWRLFALGHATTKHKPVATRDMHQERYDHYATVHEAKPSDACFGIQTGFPDLDYMMVGLNAGDVMVLAGRPSMGKTAITLEIARRVAEMQKKNVTIFSLEMSKERLFNRLFASFHGVDEHNQVRCRIPTNWENRQREFPCPLQSSK